MSNLQFFCKHCHSNDPAHFHKSNNKCCKICKNPENRAKGITPFTKHDASHFICISCNILKIKTEFDISSSGFHYDKCRKCRNPKSINTLSSHEEIIFEEDVIRENQLLEWVKQLNLSKKDIVLLRSVLNKI